MLTKLWTIAWKDIRGTFTDRSLLLIMIVTPLAIATIIALAFSQIVNGSDSPISDIPVALVNLDTGAGGFDGGQIFVNALVPSENQASDVTEEDTTPEATAGTFELGGAGTSAVLPEATPDPAACDVAESTQQVTGAEMAAQAGNTETENTTNTTTLFDLTDTTLVADAAAARAGVEDGTYAAAIIIPANFSESVTYSQAHPEFDPVQIEVYGDSGRSVSPSIIRSVVESILNQVLTGQVAVKSTLDAMIARAQTNPSFGLTFLTANNAGDFNPDFTCAFDGTFKTVGIQQQNASGEQASANLLVLFGSAQATFFALFTASGGAASILEERRNGTLQRMLVSPTSRLLVLIGKLLGIFVMVLLQLVFLFIGFTLVNALLQGEFQLIWGTDWGSLIILILALSIASAGVGMLPVALSKTPEQSQVIGSVVALFMGALGGAFFTLPSFPITEFLEKFSVVHWGSDALATLSAGEGSVWTNIVFLLMIGLVLFGASMVIFNRRQDI